MNQVLVDPRFSGLFATQAELVDALRNHYGEVPLKNECGQGEELKYKENFQICRLLATLIEQRKTDSPIEVIPSESPDFRLKFGSRSVGVECTEAVTRNAARIRAFRAKENLDPLYWLLPPQEDDSLLVRSDMERIARGGEFSVGPKASTRSRNWARHVDELVRKKQELASNGYSLLDENWLLIYDNLNGHLINQSIRALQASLDSPNIRPFDKIVIDSHDTLTFISAAEVEQFDVADIEDLVQCPRTVDID